MQMNPKCILSNTFTKRFLLNIFTDIKEDKKDFLLKLISNVRMLLLHYTLLLAI